MVLEKRLVKIGYVPNSKCSNKYTKYGSFMSFLLNIGLHFIQENVREQEAHQAKRGKSKHEFCGLTQRGSNSQETEDQQRDKENSDVKVCIYLLPD